MNAYYNENDPQAAAWLRELIRHGHIASGEVDERSITEVTAADVRGFTQCHFFAGIGGWSYALRLAGWADDRPVWTGSCPCQPFSAAGKGKGEADERHLWPAFFRLIRECRPGVVFGEQVAAAVALDWLDHVCDDLEHEGYAVGPVVLPACSVGAFHIRSRLWFVANAGQEQRRSARKCRPSQQNATERGESAIHHQQRSGACGVADAQSSGRRQGSTHAGGSSQAASAQAEWRGPAEHGAYGVALDGADQPGSQGRQLHTERTGKLIARPAGMDFWADAEWIACTDGKARPVPAIKSGFLSLADGFFYRMADVLSTYAAEAVKEINAYATSAGISAAEVMPLVQEIIETKAFRRAIGGSWSIPEAEVLLAFMRLTLATCDGANNGSGRTEASAEADRRMLRDLRDIVAVECASLRRKSEEQRVSEPANPLLALSQFLARSSQACRDHESRSHASYFPLAGRIDGRVGLLRGAGNAIVPQAAAQVIGAYMDIA